MAALVPGFTNTCLTRALVAGALLSDSSCVVLHVGFRSPGESGGEVDGHAWVTVAGCSIDPAQEVDDRAEAYADVLTISMDRGGRS